MTNQNRQYQVTAKQYGIKDFMGRAMFRIFEGNRYKTSIKAMSQQQALTFYSQQKNLSR